MFQNPMPTSTFRETVGWNVPSSQSSFSLKVPPIGSTARSSSSPSISPGRARPPVSTKSSGSSLGGLEQAVPDFQTFVRRTPSVDSNPNKPLPPTPTNIAPKRSEGSLVDAFLRRQSSVYSRSQSYVSPDQPQQSPWKIDIPPQAELPLLPLLQPIAYSASQPNLRKQAEQEEVESPRQSEYSEPRTFAPLINTPSTMSLVTTDSRVESRPQTQTLLPTAYMQAVNKKAPTMSLEEARKTMKAPGAVAMLPEELRALKKVKSMGRLESMQILGAGKLAPSPPPLPTWRDSQGRQRILSSEAINLVKSPTQNAFPVGTGPVREMAPVRPVRSDSGSEFEEPRGRTMQRTSQQGNNTAPVNQSKDDFAREYNSLLSQQFRVPSPSPAGYTSDDSIKTHMKMVPQPLFQGKQRPMSRKPAGSRNTNLSLSPFSHRRGRSESSRSSGTGFNLRLSIGDTSNSRNRASENSTIGMIPISPPIDIDSKRNKLPPIDTGSPVRPNSHRREKSASHFYPHIMHRAGFKRDTRQKGTTKIPGKPLLPADIIAQQLQTPQTTPDTSPLANSPLKTPTTPRKGSGSSIVSGRRLYSRLANGVKNRRRSSQKESSTERDLSPGAAPSPMSPHLTKSTTVYLGWSDTAKRNFDEAKSPTTPSRPRLAHIQLPPTPSEIDIRKGSYVEPPESPSITKRLNLFGGVLESWREDKANKKREDLKKMIKVVPTVGVVKEKPPPSPAASTGSRPGMGSRRGSSLFNGVPVLPAILPRRMSTYGWL